MQLSSSHPWFRLWLIAPFFLWGTAMVAMKGTVDHTTPLFLAGIRLLPAGLLVVAIAWLLKRSQPQGWQAWSWIGLFALVDGTLFQGFLAEGLVRTDAGLGSVMIDSQPLAVALLALWLYGERIGFWGWLGLAIGIAGISCIGLPDAWINHLLAGQPLSVSPLTSWSLIPEQLSHLLHSGSAWMLLAALSMAWGTVMIRRVCHYADPVAATGWHMILGSLPLFLSSGLWETQQWQQLTLHDWTALGYATVFGSAIAYALFFYFASRTNLTSISSLTFLTPVFALIFGNWFLGEVLTPIQFGGVCLTLVSIYLVNQRQQLATRWTRLRLGQGSLQVSDVALSALAQINRQSVEVSVPVREAEPDGVSPANRG